MLDGHSHSTIEMDLVKNKDGKEIPLSSTGTKLVNIGKLTISNGVFTTELVSDYAAKDDTADAFVKSIQEKNEALVNTVVARTSVDLTTKRADGTRAVRNRETNLATSAPTRTAPFPALTSPSSTAAVSVPISPQAISLTARSSRSIHTATRSASSRRPVRKSSTRSNGRPATPCPPTPTGRTPLVKWAASCRFPA